MCLIGALGHILVPMNAQPPHAVSVVFNSISHDARVLKEAHALAGAGYRVTIVGVKDNNCYESLTVYPSGARAERVECRDNIASVIKKERKSDVWGKSVQSRVERVGG